MTTDPITEAQMRCAEIRKTWLARPENAMPDPTDEDAVWDFHGRWLDSEEYAECDRIMRESFATLTPPRPHE